MTVAATNMVDSVEALVCVAPGELRLDRRPAPRQAPGEALVAVRRIGICGTDYHIYEGKHPFLEYPRVMGHELAVEVLEAPAGAAVAPGQICAVNPYLSCGTCIACRNGKPNCCVRIEVLGVHRDGGMTGLLSLPAANLVAGDGLSTDACASVEFLAIGAHAVRRSGLRGPERVLVIGAGPIGLGVAIFATIAGGRVTVMDRDPERLASAYDIAGATTIEANDAADGRVAALTGGEGFDLVFDATGNANSMVRGFDFVASGGRYVLVSVVKGPIAFEDADFHRREMTLFASRNATQVDFDHVTAAMRGGHVPLDKLITHRTTLARAVDDLPRWAVEKTGLVKALIEIPG
jgi:2-desacetyl-2-hydroxyethyl bacteriochlorophyllide A dehydrogenase